jgi:L-ornithine N5-oxygenase
MHDLIGVGFGPANLGLAIALDEQDGRPLEPLFLERSPRFTWHSGMLLRGATMQISFLKDLVTLRDPRSRFSFLCYLQDRGRLVDFVNRQDFFPTRREFHDYLEWAAASFADAVRYGCEVRSVLPVRTAGGEVGAFDHGASGGGQAFGAVAVHEQGRFTPGQDHARDGRGEDQVGTRARA